MLFEAETNGSWPIRWLFARFDGIDANFRMVRKKVSSEAADPSLSLGYAYFGEVKKYNEHLVKHGNQVVEVSDFYVCYVACVDDGIAFNLCQAPCS